MYKSLSGGVISLDSSGEPLVSSRGNVQQKLLHKPLCVSAPKTGPLSSTCQNEHLEFSLGYGVEERKEGLKNEFLSSHNELQTDPADFYVLQRACSTSTCGCPIFCDPFPTFTFLCSVSEGHVSSSLANH